MYEEHLFINKSSPVVYTLEFETGLDRSKVHLGQVIFQFRAIA